MVLKNKYVIVIEPDPQVLKGLVLLLEDMQMTVKSAHNRRELENIISIAHDCPDLIIMPNEFANDTTGHKLIKKLRLDFKRHISAILLSAENIITIALDENLLVLPDRIKPGDLRNKIHEILDDPFMI